MAHEIETAMFVGKPAWHGLGTVLQDPPTTGDALKFSGLDWNVIERPLQTYFPSGQIMPIATHKAIVRESDLKVLGVVGNTYHPLQNSDAFKFFDPFLSAGHCQLEAAGSLRGGQRIWVLAKLKGVAADIVKGDPIEAFLLLYSSHDGSLAVGVQFTTARVVCANTLSAAIRADERGMERALKVRHTAGLEIGLDAIQRAVDCTRQTFDITVEHYRELVRKNVTVIGMREYVREVFGATEKCDADPRAMGWIMESFESGAGANLDGVKGTMWGAYNAVTDWIDHARGREQATRLDATWFGAGKNLRDYAFQIALN